VIIDAIDDCFKEAVGALLSAEVVGFDSEFWCTASKYEEGGISIIQLSMHKTCYIFDYHALKDSTEFDQFFIELM
jgi:hypothetical protein